MSLVRGHINPIGDKILVTDMQFGERLSRGGIVLPTDDGKVDGIKPRWAQVWAVGPNQTDVQVGEWVLVEHGRWSRGFEVEQGDDMITVRSIDNAAILLVADQAMPGE